MSACAAIPVNWCPPPRGETVRPFSAAKRTASATSSAQAARTMSFARRAGFRPFQIERVALGGEAWLERGDDGAAKALLKDLGLHVVTFGGARRQWPALLRSVWRRAMRRQVRVVSDGAMAPVPCGRRAPLPVALYRPASRRKAC